ncbi:MAG: LamG domain-containing protein [bacterium]
MVYQIKFKKFKNKITIGPTRGFSLIELIIVIGIFILIFNISTSGFSSYKTHSNLELAANGVVEAVRFAQSNAQSGLGNSNWGVEVLSNQVIIFKGNSYVSRDSLSDENLVFSNGMSTSGLNEIVFEKFTGKTINIGDIFISNSYGEKKLSINSYGVIDYVNVASTSTQDCAGTIFGDVSNGYSGTAYLASSVSYPSLCISENRICTNGIFSGTYTNIICSVTNHPTSKWSFNEGSGCVANDLYGNNNGALGKTCPTVSPSFVVGKNGNALNFNGSSNNVLVNDSTSLNFTTSMSVSAWIKWNIDPSTGVTYATIVNKNGDNEYRLQHNVTNSKFEFGIKTDTGGTFVTSTTTPVVGVWYYLVGTWDGSYVKIYVNGILEQTGGRGGTMLSSSAPLKIGSSNIDARWFNGIIDEVSLWDRALSQQEITQIYSSNL